MYWGILSGTLLARLNFFSSPPLSRARVGVPGSQQFKAKLCVLGARYGLRIAQMARPIPWVDGSYSQSFLWLKGNLMGVIDSRNAPARMPRNAHHCVSSTQIDDQRGGFTCEDMRCPLMTLLNPRTPVRTASCQPSIAYVYACLLLSS